MLVFIRFERISAGIIEESMSGRCSVHAEEQLRRSIVESEDFRHPRNGSEEDDEEANDVHDDTGFDLSDKESRMFSASSKEYHVNNTNRTTGEDNRIRRGR